MARYIPYKCEICDILLADSRPSTIKRHEASKNHIKNQKTKPTEEQLALQRKRTEDGKKYHKKYYEEHKEELVEKNKKYYEEHKEEIAEYMKKYNQTENGIKTITISHWKTRGLNEDEFSREHIYDNIYKPETRCWFCDVVFGQKGDGSGTYKHMDHCHTSGNFRGVLCNGCNTADVLDFLNI